MFIGTLVYTDISDISFNLVKTYNILDHMNKAYKT